jgi:hypothetical protein
MLIYTSTIPSGGTLFGDSSLYFYGDYIECAAISSYETLDGYDSGIIEIGPISAIGVQGDSNFGNVGIGPVYVYATSPDLPIEAVIEIGPVGCIGSEGYANWGSARIGPVSASGEEISSSVAFSAGHVSLGPVYAYGYEGVSDTNFGEVEIGPVGGVGSEGNVGVGFIEIGPVSAFGYSTFHNYLVVSSWPDWSAALLVDEVAYVIGTIVLPNLVGSGTASRDGIEGSVKLPKWSVSGYLGAQAEIELPEWSGSGITVNPGYVSGVVVLDALTADGTISTITQVNGVATLAELTANGFIGTSGTAELSAWAANGTINNPILVTGSVTLPVFTANGTTLTGTAVSSTIELPVWLAAGTVLTGNFVYGTVTLPGWTTSGLVKYGTDTITTETTYAINIHTGAVTQLLLGTLDKLVMAHGRLYGIRSGELILLAGEYDGVSTKITATIRFAAQQFDTMRAKRIDGSIYLNTRENDGVTLTIISDETTSWDYQSQTDASPGAGTHKVKTGRGITFHSLGLKLRNRNGGRLDVGGIEIPIIPLTRRPI